LAAKRRIEIEPLMPKGARVAFAGGVDCNDHRAIWDALDKALDNHPEMVLLHGGSPKGAEFIDARKAAQIVFRPDSTRRGKAAPFKRNDQLLQTMPIGVVVFPGSGITDNLAEKARGLGIPLWRFDGGRG
jgi:YspA, cpYpsA-related SLOG family